MKQSYSLADAHRTMLAYAKANRDDYEIVQEAINYFKSHDVVPPELKEAYALAMQGGDKLLAKEEKDFAARKYELALEDLEESRRWFYLADDERRVHARAKMRSDTLFAEDSYDSIRRAMEYYNISLFGDTYALKRDAAQARAAQLGDATERTGDLELAEKFYNLAGEDAKRDAVSNKITMMKEEKERREEQTESKRQDQFQKDQKSLEKELGL
jgi:hypothetical protein